MDCKQIAGKNDRAAALLCAQALLLWSAAAGAGSATAATVTVNETRYVLSAGHPSLAKWLLPAPPEPAENPGTPAKKALGRRLFFDPQLSADGSLACSTCHNPEHGWSDGKATAVGWSGKVLHRASPTVINVAFNPLQNWDGRNPSLEKQALDPISHPDEMHLEMPELIKRLNADPDYRAAFEAAFPGEGITAGGIAKAIASFERTVISDDSPFDRWVKGNKQAMTPRQVEGFALFLNPDKGNCATCHSPPNFTDNGFYNLGLESYLQENPDMGRFEHLPLKSMRGAFKTPTLRNIGETAPYFHDGSAATLADVLEHYRKGGVENPDLSPDMRPLELTDAEMDKLEDFLLALTGPVRAYNDDRSRSRKPE